MTLDEAIRKFKAYCEGEGDFDELDFKEAVIDSNKKREDGAYVAGWNACVEQMPERMGI